MKTYHKLSDNKKAELADLEKIKLDIEAQYYGLLNHGVHPSEIKQKYLKDSRVIDIEKRISDIYLNSPIIVEMSHSEYGEYISKQADELLHSCNKLLDMLKCVADTSTSHFDSDSVDKVEENIQSWHSTTYDLPDESGEYEVYTTAGKVDTCWFSTDLYRETTCKHVRVPEGLSTPVSGWYDSNSPTLGDDIQRYDIVAWRPKNISPF